MAGDAPGDVWRAYAPSDMGVADKSLTVRIQRGYHAAAVSHTPGRCQVAHAIRSLAPCTPERPFAYRAIRSR